VWPLGYTVAWTLSVTRRVRCPAQCSALQHRNLTAWRSERLKLKMESIPSIISSTPSQVTVRLAASLSASASVIRSACSGVRTKSSHRLPARPREVAQHRLGWAWADGPAQRRGRRHDSGVRNKIGRSISYLILAVRRLRRRGRCGAQQLRARIKDSALLGRAVPLSFKMAVLSLAMRRRTVFFTFAVPEPALAVPHRPNAGRGSGGELPGSHLFRLHWRGRCRLACSSIEEVPQED